MNRSLTLLDIVTIISFFVGLYALELAMQNLAENRLQSKDSEKILYQLENHLREQDDHLQEQDRLLGKEA